MVFAVKKLSIAVVVLAMFAGPAMSADLAVPPPQAVPVATPVYDWSGFYLGGFGTYTTSHLQSTTTNTATGISFAPTTSSESAFHGGGQVGLDYMFPSHIVIGIVGDLSSGHTTTSTTTDATGTFGNWNDTAVSGTIRGRLGYAINRILLYATGGWAWSSASAARTQIAGKAGGAVAGTSESVHFTPEGWTAGGGVAFAVTENWNVFAEYRFANLKSTTTFPIAQRSTNSSSDVNVLEVGVNLKINWGY
jgi:outer membrane immunogenic protein